MKNKLNSEEIALIVKKRTITTLEAILWMYAAPDRYYHNAGHIGRMLDRIKYETLNEVDTENLVLAVLFHDIIYVPGSTENEDLSAEFFHSVTSQIPEFRDECSKVYYAILETNYIHKQMNRNSLERQLVELDLYEAFYGTDQQIKNNYINVYQENARLLGYDHVKFRTANLQFMKDRIFPLAPEPEKMYARYELETACVDLSKYAPKQEHPFYNS